MFAGGNAVEADGRDHEVGDNVVVEDRIDAGDLSEPADGGFDGWAGCRWTAVVLESHRDGARCRCAVVVPFDSRG